MDPVTGEATKSVISHVERELNYIIRFKRNIKDLGDNIAALEANIKDVRSWVDAARNNNHSIRNTVETWLEQADRLFEEATQLKSEAGDINSWWKGWVTCSRFSLGRKAAKKNVDIPKHLAEGSKFGENVCDPRPVQSYEPEPVGDFQTFESRKATKSKVIEALRADKNSLVGIYGMPGVGKTMLMQAIMAQVKKEKLFDEVVMVVVSQKPDLEKIQDAIAEKLDLKFKGNWTRAEDLWERLNQERKTTLLCLDDVWERMDLVKVGIPYKNAGIRCKVIFTTRIQGVCESMEMDEKIEVKVLSEVDSWNLFKSKAGVVVDSSVFETVAENIVKECKGLPLAIVTLGLALRNKDDIAVWDDTLAKLKKSIYDERMERVNASIRLSYDFLQDETTKMCFLFCCMFPEDCQIPTDVLFGYMMGEKLIRNVDTFEEARNRLQATVEKLTSAGLLLKDDLGCIMMHDVVRDVAVSIACEERNEFIVKAKISFDEWSDMELEKCKRLSLMDTKIRYPSQIKAPNLLTLSLNSFNDLHELIIEKKNDLHEFPSKFFKSLVPFSSLNEIPSNFFQEMTNLLTLDLSNTNIRSLPTSLSSLTNLRTLHLNNCNKLTNISPVVKLNRLEILCLNESGIENFPEEMGSLTSLKSLNFLRTTLPYTTISPKVISRLFRLEEFSGNYIENLQFSSENDSSPWKKMTRFKISLGKYDISHLKNIRQMERTEFRRSLLLTLSSISISISHLIQVLLPKTIFLYLKCEGIENVLQLDKIEVSFPNLRVLAVDKCGKLVTLIPESVNQYEGDDVGDGVEQGSSSTRLCYLPPSPIFHNLTHLAITNCPKLKHLFPLRVFQHLSKLEKMYVESCSALEILFRDDSDIESGDVEKDKASHHLLKAFVLLGLPKLSSFSGSDSLVVDWPSAISLDVSECSNLKRLPLGTHSVPKLETFTISDQEWFNKLEWDDQRIKAELQTLLVLEVKDSD